MSDKEKVMAVTIVHTDLYDSADYTGACLNLPASRDEIRDAIDRARIRGGQPYKIEECLNMQGDELSFIPGDPSLEELNFLAHRISKMNEHDKIAFTGCAMMGDGHPSMQFLINLTYNLDNVHAVPAKNDQELGKFYVDNDFIDAVNHVPPEYQEEILEWLDYEKIGCCRRETEGGVFHNGFYVVNTSGTLDTVYDGVQLPDMPEEPAYVFRLRLAEASRTSDNSGPEHCVPLLLPAAGGEILAALKQIGAASLEECALCHCESPIPALEQAFSFSEDIGRMNLLAEHIRSLEERGELPKLKAVLEIHDWADVDQVLDLTLNLDCYDFFPELLPDIYGEEIIIKHGLDTSDNAFALFDFGDFGERMMHKDKLLLTDYGAIRRNDREMVLKHSAPRQGQQML